MVGVVGSNPIAPTTFGRVKARSVQRSGLCAFWGSWRVGGRQDVITPTNAICGQRAAPSGCGALAPGARSCWRSVSPLAPSAWPLAGHGSARPRAEGVATPGDGGIMRRLPGFGVGRTGRARRRGVCLERLPSKPPVPSGDARRHFTSTSQTFRRHFTGHLT